MKQKGQALVEFAFVVPIMTAFLLAIIYVGMFFVDFIHYNNAVRYAARDLALIPIESQRAERISNVRYEDYVEPVTKLYTPVMTAKIDDDGVKVTLNLTRKKYSALLEPFIVLPENFNIDYKMKIEKLSRTDFEPATPSEESASDE